MEQKDWLHELEDIMAALRAPGGCPWDRKQTHESLKPFMIEEASEVLDAIDGGDRQELKDELGDVLMNVYLHAQIAKENDDFTIQDVAQIVSEKMIRRHPHVFSDANAETPEAVEAQWAEIKKKEKGENHKTSALDGVSRSLPTLMRTQKIQKKASKVGFDWSDYQGPLAKVKEEIAAFEEALSRNHQEDMRDEFGDILFSMVNLARHTGISADDSLNGALRKFTQRFEAVESLSEEKGKELKEMSLEEMDQLWDEVKKS